MYSLSWNLTLSFSLSLTKVPLLRRSFQLFSELSAASGGDILFQRTGSLDIGPSNEATFQGSVLSCQQHGLKHEILEPEQLSKRFPAWTVPEGYKACYQPDGGMLFPEKVIRTTAKLARQHGAEFMEQCEVTDIAVREDGIVLVRTKDGRTFLTRHVILSSGAWLPTLLQKSVLGKQSPRLSRLATMLKPERQVVTWYEVNRGCADRFLPELHPVWIATLDKAHYYGFPLLADGSPGVKIGRYHHAHETLDTESSLNDYETRSFIHPRDRTYTDRFITTMFAGSCKSDPNKDEVLKSQSCIFTNTPDEHFIIDPRPDPALPQVSLISACSGHGFKFSTVLGEVMARFVLEGPEEVEKTLPVKWLDAGRLLGDRPPMELLDPHREIQRREKNKKE